MDGAMTEIADGGGAGAPQHETDAERMSAAEKTLVVLEAALAHRRLTDVVAATGLAKSTVHRITSLLVARGFVQVDGEGSFLPGPKALQLAGRALEHLDISELVSPQIDALVAATHCTVHIAGLNGDEAVYVARRDSEKPYRMPSRVGKSISLHTTGIGKTILAAMPAEQVDGIIARTGLPTRTPNTIGDADTLRGELRLIAERGYAFDDEENEPGIRCVAAPIRDHTGRTTYGVSISTLTLEHSIAQLRTLAPIVIEAAAEISRILGHAPRT
jgi:DNA-binding IclR family transcriptional regulator